MNKPRILKRKGQWFCFVAKKSKHIEYRYIGVGDTPANAYYKLPECCR